MKPCKLTYRGHRITAQAGRWTVTDVAGSYVADFPKLHLATAWLDRRANEDRQDPWRRI